MKAAYVKFNQPASRFALTAVFVAKFADGVRVAVTGASNNGVFRWTDAESALGAGRTINVNGDASFGNLADALDDISASGNPAAQPLMSWNGDLSLEWYPNPDTLLAAAVLDWRDPDLLTQPAGGAEDPDYAAAGLPYGAKDGEMESVAELEQVLGMTPGLYAKVEPYITVHSGRAAPDPAFAPAVVLNAMGQDGNAVVAARTGPVAGNLNPTEAGQLVASGSGTYSIESRARLPDGRESVLRAVVRVGGNSVPGMAYTVLRWEEGASPR